MGLQVMMGLAKAECPEQLPSMQFPNWQHQMLQNLLLKAKISTTRRKLLKREAIQLGEFHRLFLLIIFLSNRHAGSISSRSSMDRPSARASTKRSHGGEFQPQIIVKDEQGKDVTPISLLSLKPSVLQQHSILMSSADGSPGVRFFNITSTF
jgi:hypothetical protein